MLLFILFTTTLASNAQFKIALSARVKTIVSSVKTGLLSSMEHALFCVILRIAQIVNTPNWASDEAMLADFQRLNAKAKAAEQGVPDAPFKKNWEEMALKRLIHHAAEKGYHGIVVTPGAEQADRYSLAKHIDSIMLVPNPYPNKETRPYIFKAFDNQGGSFF